MELQEFIKKFSDQFDETAIDEINENTVYQNLDEWSSLLALSIIAFVKIDFSKTITGSELRNCTTVKNLFELIQLK